MTTNDLQVFLSYAREDFEMAEKLYQDLTHYGINVWFDKKSLEAGKNWKIEIRKAIQNSSHFLLLLSSNSVLKRGFYQKEIRDALEVIDELPEGQVFIIPVRLDDCEVSNERLKEIHWLDLFESYERGFRNLLIIFGFDYRVQGERNTFFDSDFETKESSHLSEWLDDTIKKYDKIFQKIDLGNYEVKHSYRKIEESTETEHKEKYKEKIVAPQYEAEDSHGKIEETTEREYLERKKEKIVTSTLGEIYAAQHQYAKAIGVYEILRRKDPENVLYQQKIEYLQNKLLESQSEKG